MQLTFEKYLAKVMLELSKLPHGSSWNFYHVETREHASELKRRVDSFYIETSLVEKKQNRKHHDQVKQSQTYLERWNNILRIPMIVACTKTEIEAEIYFRNVKQKRAFVLSTNS